MIVIVVRFYAGFILANLLASGQPMEKGGQTLKFFCLQLSLPLYLIQTGIVAGPKQPQQLQHGF